MIIYIKLRKSQGIFVFYFQEPFKCNLLHGCARRLHYWLFWSDSQRRSKMELLNLINLHLSLFWIQLETPDGLDEYTWQCTQFKTWLYIFLGSVLSPRFCSWPKFNVKVWFPIKQQKINFTTWGTCKNCSNFCKMKGNLDVSSSRMCNFPIKV